MKGAVKERSVAFSRDPLVARSELETLVLNQLVGLKHDISRPILVGMSGAQGCGKSTLTRWLVDQLNSNGLRSIGLSLDDFYLGRRARKDLARSVHPLLETRGVPGTHDIKLLGHCVDRLLSTTPADIKLPIFEKSSDELLPETEWPRISGLFDFVVLEGWCVGARPQSRGELMHPVNSLERDEDPNCVWRCFVNRQLREEYCSLWDRLDLRLFLKAPDFSVVERWRSQQEAGLVRSQVGKGVPLRGDSLRRFISHFERITRWMNLDEPADYVIALDKDRCPCDYRPRITANKQRDRTIHLR